MANWILGYGVIRSNSKENLRDVILRFDCKKRDEIFIELGLDINESTFPKTCIELFSASDLNELIDTAEELFDKDGVKYYRVEFTASFGYSIKSSLLIDEKFYFCHGDGTRIEGFITLEEACLKHNSFVEIFSRGDGFEERVLVDSNGTRITYESRDIETIEDEDEHETYIGGFTDEWDWPWVL